MKRLLILFLSSLGLTAAITTTGCISQATVDSSPVAAITTTVDGAVQAAFIIKTDEKIIPHKLLAVLIQAAAVRIDPTAKVSYNEALEGFILLTSNEKAIEAVSVLEGVLSVATLHSREVPKKK